jgi:NSS family neurotransmitter:Na+ symporter
MMPALFVILLFLVAYAAVTADFYSAVQFMFVPDFDRLDSQVVLLALGQAFFSLSVGGGGIIAYGAYLQREASIPKTAVLIASANVSVDLLAGLAIFPIVFSYGLQAGAGPGLLFEALPVAFGQMPGGQIVGSLFFVLVLFAALSTSISMLESVVSRLVERPGASRARMTLIAGSLIWSIGLGSVFSYNLLADFEPLGFITMFEGFTIFRLVDFFVVNVLILTSALLLTLFVGYVMSRQATQEEWGGDHVLFRLWRFNMRYIAPPVIFLIFVVTMIGQ